MRVRMVVEKKEHRDQSSLNLVRNDDDADSRPAAQRLFQETYRGKALTPPVYAYTAYCTRHIQFVPSCYKLYGEILIATAESTRTKGKTICMSDGKSNPTVQHQLQGFGRRDERRIVRITTPRPE